MEHFFSAFTLAAAGVLTAAAAIGATSVADRVNERAGQASDATASRDLPNLPDALRPAGARPLSLLHARGVQIYRCDRPKPDAAPQWVFVAPEAALYEPSGERAGLHGAGPFWQALDGSRIEGRVAARMDAPIHGAIPWLLLTAKAGAEPGRLAAVTHVARIRTAGGLAPDGGCLDSAIGQQAHVPYTADYLLLGEVAR